MENSLVILLNKKVVCIIHKNINYVVLLRYCDTRHKTGSTATHTYIILYESTCRLLCIVCNCTRVYWYDVLWHKLNDKPQYTKLCYTAKSDLNYTNLTQPTN